MLVCPDMAPIYSAPPNLALPPVKLVSVTVKLAAKSDIAPPVPKAASRSS